MRTHIPCLPHAAFFNAIFEEQLSPRKRKDNSHGFIISHFLVFSLSVASSAGWRCALTCTPSLCFSASASGPLCSAASEQDPMFSAWSLQYFTTAGRMFYSLHCGHLWQVTSSDGSVKVVQWLEKSWSHGGHSRESLAVCLVLCVSLGV